MSYKSSPVFVETLIYYNRLKNIYNTNVEFYKYFLIYFCVINVCVLQILDYVLSRETHSSHKPNLARALAKSYQELRSCKYLQVLARWTF